MKKSKFLMFVITSMFLLFFFSVTDNALAADYEQSCWGQASALYAQMGYMGDHASEFETPRVGLRNLARELYASGAIPDDSMAALGAFVATAEGLSIEACGTD